MTSAPRFCGQCGAKVRLSARYCPACGCDLPGTRDVEAARHRARRRLETGEDRRVTAGLAVTFGATIAALVFEGWCFERWLLEESFLFVLVHAGLLLGAGVLGAFALGRGAWRASLGGGTTWSWMAAAPLVGAGSFALAMLYVHGMARLGGVNVEASTEGASLAMLVLVIVVAPVTEEWLDRGVAWTACRRATGPVTTLIATSALFAFSHGLNGGGVLEFPHRFLGGLALGWLRWRSGSLLPSILAHGVWNALAMS